jgi:hypothetical protein
MGSQESKQEVINEQVIVNAGTITADEKTRVLIQFKLKKTH